MFNYSFFKILKISFVLIFLVFFLFPFSLFAQERPEVPEIPFIGRADIQTIVVRIIQIVLSLLGIIALGLIIWAGFLWMTAAGVEEKISKAKKILIGAIIGLIIVFSSWAITFFLIRALTEATSSSEPSGPPPEFPEKEFFITSVIPKENATGVFRNSQVIANFNKRLKEGSINSNSVIIKKTLTGEAIKGTLSVGNNSLKLVPEASCLEKEACHCFDANTQYTVIIKGGSQGVLSYEDDKLSRDKIWSFITSDLLDLEKPVVYDYYPTSPPDAPRNSQIQVTFSKEIDPLSINKDTVKVKQADKEIDGEFNLGEDGFSFVPATFCPSPNENLRCFDKNVDISVSLSGTIQDYTGCNSLDCANGKCQWTFHTSEEIDTEPPYILEGSLVPKRNEKEVDRGTNIKATFSKAMNRVTINSATVTLQDQQANQIHPFKIELIGFKTLVFDPKEILEKEMIHGVTVFGGKIGVKSASGISMEKNFSWGFKTSKEAFGGKPYIDSIDPVSGPEGTCLTVKGVNLKTSGELLFRKIDGTFIRASEIGVWQDEYITGVVPAGLGYTIPPGEKRTFWVVEKKTQVKAIVEDKESNLVEFTLTDSELGACLLRLEPKSGKWGSEVVLKGERFGQTKEANDGAIFHQISVKDFLSWQNKEIKVKVPELASDGLVKVVKKGKNSNGIYFDVENFPENKCTENNQCQPPNSSCCQNNICKENCPPVVCLENVDCLTDCCINNFCQASLICKGGVGDSCDGNKESIGCQLNNNLCLSSLICRESDCTCQKSEKKIHRKCSEDKCVIVEGPGEDKCTIDLNCGEGAEHRECLKDKCVVVIGPGSDQCTADKNCGPNALHNECSENQCKEIKGQGLDQCKENKDCQGPIVIEGCEKETWTYQNSKYNFIIQYCKKDFPEAKKGLDIIKVSDKEIFFQGQEKNDAIGLRIEENRNFYSPLWWYKWKFPKSQAFLQEMEVDGYSAIKEGDTIYVGATNIESNKIVPYIFIISKNDKASQVIGKILDQMFENWRFNTNL